MSKQSQVSELITEVNRLAAKCDRKTKSIAELEAENEQLQIERDATADLAIKDQADNELLRAAMRKAQKETGTSTSTWHVLEAALKGVESNE